MEDKVRQDPEEAPGWEAARENLLRFYAGDKGAWDQLDRWLRPRLLRYFGRRVRNLPEEPEDLAQYTLLKIVQSKTGARYAADKPLPPWVSAIARHVLTDTLRGLYRPAPEDCPPSGAVGGDRPEAPRLPPARIRVEVPLPDSDLAEKGKPLDEQVALRRALRDCLDRLPNTELKILEEYALKICTLEMLAAEHQHSIGWIHEKKEQGKRALDDCLQEKGYSPQKRARHLRATRQREGRSHG